MLDRAVYRTRQLFAALRGTVTETERAAARQALGDELYPLFESMQAADQRHCLDVFERLLQDGSPDAEMLQAALIHDAGKGDLSGARIGIADRVGFVLLSPFPGLLAKAPSGSGLASLRDHSGKTLELATEHGAAEGVIALIEEMDGLRPATERGRALKRADDRS